METQLRQEHIEAWLDDHADFAFDYFTRKATQTMVNTWLADRVIRIAGSDRNLPSTERLSSKTDSDPIKRPSSVSSDSPGRKTPIRKISHEEINPGHLPLKPMVSTNEMGSPSFYTPENVASPSLTRRITVPNRQTNKHMKNFKTRRISHYHQVQKADLELDNDHVNADDDPPVIDERDMIMDLVIDIASDLDVTSVSHRILQNVSILLDADRCSLFLMRERDGEKFLVSRLFNVSKESTLEDNVVVKNEIKMKLGQGIAGMVALTGTALNIPDAYKDSRFNQSVDKKTGYRTRSILCMPIRDGDKRIVGVAQVINKIEGAFTNKDEKIFASYLGFCGVAIHNAQIFEKIQLENRRNEILLDLARVLFEEQSSLHTVMDTILTHTISLLCCERASVLLANPSQPENVFEHTFEHVDESTLISGINLSKEASERRKVPFNIAITSFVRQTGQIVNIENAANDKRFEFLEDAQLGFTTRSLLCIPIRDSMRQVIGVIQLINKHHRVGPCFTKSDEQILEAFTIFCGLGISNTRMYEETARLAAKQHVILEVLSYHAVASPYETSLLTLNDIPSAKSLGILTYDFDDSRLDDHDTLRAAVRMFIDLNLVEKFRINHEVLCRWVASVKRNYRPVSYHNWRHAFNVCQSCFCMIKTGGLDSIFSDYEKLSLLVSCLSHDLDHRGTNNAFQAKIEHPLARLYSTSTMEHHHYNQCLMLLQSEGCEILSHLTSSEYAHVIKLVQHAILSTDLAIYFKKRNEFFNVVKSGAADWLENDGHRELLRSLVITGCDIAGITRPWNVQKEIAQLVAEEFFEQGDIEKSKLHQEPPDMMNRKLKHKLPKMQIGFIDSICLPLYEALNDVSTKLQPMLDGCLENRRHWEEESLKAERGGTAL
ncbi:dual 3',5'-cyclic-AMP and -GMP phosphodiesterase 11-like isoform X1 [Ciona intestinalis]